MWLSSMRSPHKQEDCCAKGGKERARHRGEKHFDRLKRVRARGPTDRRELTRANGVREGLSDAFLRRAPQRAAFDARYEDIESVVGQVAVALATP